MKILISRFKIGVHVGPNIELRRGQLSDSLNESQLNIAKSHVPSH